MLKIIFIGVGLAVLTLTIRSINNYLYSLKTTCVDYTFTIYYLLVQEKLPNSYI